MNKYLPSLAGIHDEATLSKLSFPLELTFLLWTQCNLRCFYCNTGDCDDEQAPIDCEYILRTLQELKNSAVETIIFQGPGEPFLYKDDFIRILTQVNDSGFTAVVFTNGTLLNSADIDRISRMDVSLVFKVDSLKESDMIEIYGVPARYSFSAFDGVSIPTAMKYALDLGLQKSSRIGLSCVVSHLNSINEYFLLKQILRFARRNSIIPYFNSIMKRKKNNPDISYTLSALSAFEALSVVDSKEFGFSWKPTLPTAGYNHVQSQGDYFVLGSMLHKWKYGEDFCRIIDVCTVDNLIQSPDKLKISLQS